MSENRVLWLAGLIFAAVVLTTYWRNRNPITEVDENGEELELPPKSAWRRFFGWVAITILVLASIGIFAIASQRDEEALSARLEFEMSKEQAYTRTNEQLATKEVELKDAEARVMSLRESVDKFSQVEKDAAKLREQLAAAEAQLKETKIQLEEANRKAKELTAGDEARKAEKRRQDEQIAALEDALRTAKVQVSRNEISFGEDAVLFPTDKWDIECANKDVMAKVIAYTTYKMGTTPLSAVISGYTDDTGTPAHNKALSERRANSVLNYLTAAGIPSGRMSAIGHGMDRPVPLKSAASAPLSVAEVRKRNRRVEIKFE